MAKELTREQIEGVQHSNWNDPVTIKICRMALAYLDSREEKDPMAQEFLEGDKFFKLGYELGKKDGGREVKADAPVDAVEIAKMAFNVGNSHKPNGDRNEAIRIIAQTIEYYADPAMKVPKAMRTVEEWCAEFYEMHKQKYGERGYKLDMGDFVRAIQADALQSKGCALPPIITVAEAAKISDQCWAQDATDKWIVRTGLDTVCMEGFIRENTNRPAIPIYHPAAPQPPKE